MQYNFEERYKEIREKLISEGHANKNVTYDEFLFLYEPYKEEMSEKEFATVLGVSYGNWQSIKNRGTKTKILKQTKTEEENEKLKQRIIRDLIAKGYVGKNIGYSDFLELYKPYEKQLIESEFASYIGISYGNWQQIKNKGQKAKILKQARTEGEKEELKQRIIRDLIEKGYVGKKIGYSEFLELYKPYEKHLIESEFASYIGISYGNWQQIKHIKGRKTKILKQARTEEENEELKQRIIRDLIAKGYEGKSIGYSEFLELYKPYEKQLKESEFASYIGISYGNWQNIKNKGRKAKILKPTKTEGENKELKQRIIRDLIVKGYVGKSIGYSEFLELYKPYEKQLKESEFASYIGILYGNWQSIKNKGQKAKILKQAITEGEKEELKQRIIRDLIAKGYERKSIEYSEFLELYKPYEKQLKESEFASYIGISYKNWESIKNKGTKAKILKQARTEEENEELKQRIIRDLIAKGYERESIGYSEFLELYKPYEKKLREREFASYIGISYGNWQHIKHKGTKAIVNFEYNLSIRLLYLFNENKEYDIQYFEKVSNFLGITIEKILQIITKDSINLQDLINVLYQKGKIFVGKIEVSNNFLNKNGEQILKIIQAYSSKIGGMLHTSFFSEDIAQEAILITIEKRGDIERNFEEEVALKIIMLYAKKICKNMHLQKFSEKKVVSLDESLTGDGTLKLYDRVKAKINVQDTVEEIQEKVEVSEGDTPIIVIQQCLLNGMNREDSLSFVMEKFNLSREELLQILTEELTKRKSIKVAQNGEIYLGERD